MIDLSDQIVLRVAERLGGDLDLLVVRGVHEVEMVAVVVHVLHFALVERRTFDVFLRAELLVHQRLRPDVPHPHLDVRALVARGQVMQFEQPNRPLPTFISIAFTKSRRLDVVGHRVCPYIRMIVSLGHEFRKLFAASCC